MLKAFYIWTLAQLAKLAENQFGGAPNNESDDWWSLAGDESCNASGDDQSAGDESCNASEDDERLEESATANDMTAPSEALKSCFWSKLIQMDLKELEARPTGYDQYTSSLQEPIDKLTERIGQLTLQGKPLKIHDWPKDDDTKELTDALLNIYPS